MTRHTDISNFADIIDSRDIIARIKELEDARADALIHLEDIRAEIATIQAHSTHEITLADADRLNTLEASIWVAENGVEYGESAEYGENENAELTVLLALAEEASDYAPDWRHGEALIRDSYFETYARDLADDIGAVKSDASWPNSFIDWEAASEALKQDYTSVDYDGVTYWIRS